MHVVKDILFAHVFPRISERLCVTIVPLVLISQYIANHGGKKLPMIHVRATAVLFKKQHHHEHHDDKNADACMQPDRTVQLKNKNISQHTSKHEGPSFFLLLLMNER